MSRVECFPYYINVYDPNTTNCPTCGNKIDREIEIEQELVSVYQPKNIPMKENMFRDGNKIYRKYEKINMYCYNCSLNSCQNCFGHIDKELQSDFCDDCMNDNAKCVIN